MLLVKLPDKSGALHCLKKNPNDMNEVIGLKYLERKQISPDTIIFIYEIPNELTLGLNLGQHIAIE
jgi:hypothetical protein